MRSPSREQPLSPRPGKRPHSSRGQHEQTQSKRITPQVSSAQSLSRVRLFVTTRTAARQASLSITSFWSLFKLMSIKSVMPSSHLLLCRPLLLLPPIPLSIRAFPMSQLFA